MIANISTKYADYCTTYEITVFTIVFIQPDMLATVQHNQHYIITRYSLLCRASSFFKFLQPRAPVKRGNTTLLELDQGTKCLFGWVMLQQPHRSIIISTNTPIISVQANDLQQQSMKKEAAHGRNVYNISVDDFKQE